MRYAHVTRLPPLMRSVARTALALLVAAPLAAQGTPAAAAAPARTPSFGVIAGVNLANIRGDGADGDARTGLVVGVTARIPFAANLAFQPELHFSQKGSRFRDEDFSGTLALSYAELPLHLRYEVPVSGGVRPYLLAGPTLALRTGCSVSGGGISVDCDEIEDFIGSEGDGFKRVDFGLSIGGGVDFPIGGRTGTVMARYGYGLADLADATTAGNRVIQFGVGLRF